MPLIFRSVSNKLLNMLSKSNMPLKLDPCFDGRPGNDRIARDARNIFGMKNEEKIQELIITTHKSGYNRKTIETFRTTCQCELAASRARRLFLEVRTKDIEICCWCSWVADIKSKCHVVSACREMPRNTNELPIYWYVSQRRCCTTFCFRILCIFRRHRIFRILRIFFVVRKDFSLAINSLWKNAPPQPPSLFRKYFPKVCPEAATKRSQDLPHYLPLIPRKHCKLMSA